MTTIENNKLIADFIGYIDNGCSEDGFLICPQTNYDIEVDSLKYNSDWDELMQVVEKIEQSKFVYEFCIFFDCFNSEQSCIIQPNFKHTFSKIQHKGSSKINVAYNACIEFIKWYNQNK